MDGFEGRTVRCLRRLDRMHHQSDLSCIFHRPQAGDQWQRIAKRDVVGKRICPPQPL